MPNPIGKGKKGNEDLDTIKKYWEIMGNSEKISKKSRKETTKENANNY